MLLKFDNKQNLLQVAESDKANRHITGGSRGTVQPNGHDDPKILKQVKHLFKRAIGMQISDVDRFVLEPHFRLWLFADE